jgi:hypothetical protein
MSGARRRLLALHGLMLLCMIVSSVMAFRAAGRMKGFIEQPVGCDDFGYLRQARLFREHGLLRGLDTSIADPTSQRLLAVLKSSGMPQTTWNEYVAPPCHHYKPQVDKVVLQYPPGTGLVLSLFPEGTQARYVGRAVVFLVLAGILGAIAFSASPSTPVLAAYLASVCFVAAVWFSYSLSIAPSMLTALALGALAGLKLDFSRLGSGWRWHALAGFLLGVATELRIPNGFMAAGFVAAYAVAWLWHPTARGLAAPLAFACACAIGLLPLLIANTINAGSPFATTYSAVDAARPVLSWASLREGLNFFVNERPVGAVTLLLGSIPILVLAIYQLIRPARRNAIVLLAILVNLVSNLGYFILHDPREAYYLAPLAMFVGAAAAFALIASFEGKTAPAVVWPRRVLRSRMTAAVACFALVALGAWLQNISISPLFDNDAKPRTFDDRTMIWADSSAGLFHYFQNRQASKLAIAPDILQDRIMRLVADRGFQQVVVADSPPSIRMIDRLRQEGRATPDGQAFGYNVFIVQPPR